MASDDKQVNAAPTTVVLANTTPAAAKVDCTSIMAAAKKYYKEAGDGTLQLKAYDVPADKLPGEVAAGIPRLGDIAGCKKR